MRPVRLSAMPGVAGSDYINASYIDGVKRRAAFIATQGPKEDTVPQFWQMVWEQEVDIVVMLTELKENGRIKSEQYWPDVQGGSHVGVSSRHTPALPSELPQPERV